jgi:hypothetical protein
LKQLLSIKSVVKYVWNQVNLLNKSTMSSSREKQETDSLKNPGSREQKMPWFGGFIWRTGGRTTGSPTV